MFSHNGLISKKQNNCMIMIYVFAGCIFVLPYLLAKMFGHSIGVGALLFFAVASVYTAIIFLLEKTSDKRRSNTENEICHNYFYVLIQVVRFMIRLVFYIILAVAILSEGQVPFVDKDGGNSVQNIILLLPLLLVALYGASKDIEKQGRLSEMIFPAVFFPFALMIAFGIGEIGSFTDFLSGGGGFLDAVRGQLPNDMLSVPKMILYCISLLTFIVPVEICPWLKSKLNNKADASVKTFLYIEAVILFMVVLSLLMAGIYGVCGMADRAAVTVAIMRYIELPLGLLSRFDVLMVWFFMAACFAYFCITLFVIRNMLLGVVSKKASAIMLFLIVIASCLLAYRCPQYKDVIGVYVLYGAFVDVPLSLIMSFIKNVSFNYKKIISIFLVLGMLLLTGCSTEIENVEQRDYATVLMATIGKDNENHYLLGIAKEHRTGEKSNREDFFETDAYNLDELSKKYGEQKGKDLSLSHLKVILTAVKFDEGAQDEMYKRFVTFTTELDKEEEIAATCPLLLVHDENRIVDNMHKMEEPIGTYIEDMVRFLKKDDKKVPKLMDYLKAVREGKNIDMYELTTINDDFKIVSVNKK